MEKVLKEKEFSEMISTYNNTEVMASEVVYYHLCQALGYAPIKYEKLHIEIDTEANVINLKYRTGRLLKSKVKSYECPLNYLWDEDFRNLIIKDSELRSINAGELKSKLDIRVQKVSSLLDCLIFISMSFIACMGIVLFFHLNFSSTMAVVTRCFLLSIPIGFGIWKLTERSNVPLKIGA